MTYIPHFLPQNPDLNGDPEGWSSCSAYSGAMAADYSTLGKVQVSGRAVRSLTHDHSGGLTLQQVDRALLDGWDVNLSTSLGIAWTDFAKKVNAGCAAILQGGYAPIADSRYDAGRGFRDNHAILVLPGWIGMDPMADGRYGQAYKFRGEAYPQSLLRAFAGKLDLNGNGRLLGAGKAYASFTRDNVHTYHLSFRKGSFWVYQLGPNGMITSRRPHTFRKATGAPCGAPSVHAWPGQASRTLVQVTAGLLAGEYVAIPQSTVSLSLVP